MTHDLTPALTSHWQPMASAPHNEDILVFSRRRGLMIAAFRPEFTRGLAKAMSAALNDDDVEHFIHWMPLPGRPDARTARAPRHGGPPGLPASSSVHRRGTPPDRRIDPRVEALSGEP